MRKVKMSFEVHSLMCDFIICVIHEEYFFAQLFCPLSGTSYQGLTISYGAASTTFNGGMMR